MGKSDELNNICRICLEETNEELQCVFNTNKSTGKPVQFSEMLMACATVTVNLGDGLPEQICSNCAQATIKTYLFKLKCEESDKALRNRVNGRSSFRHIEKIEIKSEIKEEPSLVEIKYNNVEELDLIEIKEEPSLVEIKCDNVVEESDLMEIKDNNVEEWMDSSEDGYCVPPSPDIDQSIKNLDDESPSENLLTEKSKKLYTKTYTDFKDWCKSKGECEVSENVLLIYLNERANNRKASSLWSTFSMLKQTLKLYDNINIAKYYKVLAYLKRKNDNYKPKKAAMFEPKDITKFITEAPDETFFPTKVILIMGIAGACRTDELCNMKVTDLDVREDLIIIKIPEAKNKTSRKFVITEPLWTDVVKRYLAARPSPDMERLLIGFRFGKPVRQNIGHNTITNAPNKIAKYLKLPNADEYTGHSLRRTSATILANNRNDVLTLKRQAVENGSICDKKKNAEIVQPTAPSLVSSDAVPSSSATVKTTTIGLQPVYIKLLQSVMP